MCSWWCLKFYIWQFHPRQCIPPVLAPPRLLPRKKRHLHVNTEAGAGVHIVEGICSPWVAGAPSTEPPATPCVVRRVGVLSSLVIYLWSFAEATSLVDISVKVYVKNNGELV